MTKIEGKKKTEVYNVCNVKNSNERKNKKG